MLVSIVVAVAENGIIGRGGGLPWRLSSDLKTFRRITMSKPMIMGRRTFQSLKKPLDGRDNIVITRDPDYRPEGALMAADFATALEIARTCAERRGADEITVIGGNSVFAEALPLTTRIYKTEVHAEITGDVSFPEVDWSAWKVIAREALPRGPNDDFPATLVVLERP
jgi:dihydrofolate reductase